MVAQAREKGLYHFERREHSPFFHAKAFIAR